jgi:Cysteine-rich secretory protein family
MRRVAGGWSISSGGEDGRSRPLVFAAQTCLVVGAPVGSFAAVSDFDLPISAMNRRRHRRAAVELVNRERRSHGLGGLRYAQSLRISAHAWALAITRSSRFTHGAFAKRALRFPFVLRSRGRRWKVGENLAWGIGESSTPRSIVAAWMASAEHRRNISGSCRL